VAERVLDAVDLVRAGAAHGLERGFTETRSTTFQPSPSAAKPRFSSHIASNQENGT
jgi:hypothetical protein